MLRKINAAGEELVKSFEGLELHAYQDSVRVWTIGWGHTGNDVHAGLVITEAQAETLFQSDMAGAEADVTRLVTVPLNDNQFAAMVSLVFNVGPGCLINTHIASALSVKNYSGAANHILDWNHAGGHVLAGLTRRREAERKLFLTAIPTTSPTC